MIDPRALVLTSLTSIAFLALSCSVADGPPPIQTEQPIHELLLHADRQSVVRENPERPVRQNLVRPSRPSHGERGPLPSLELTPPAEVVWDVPASYPEAILRFALCIGRGQYRGRGEVRVEVELDGRPVLVQVLPSGADLAGPERRWHHHEIPIGAGGELRVRTHYEGDQPIPPKVGLGNPRVVVPLEVERRPPGPDTLNVLMVVVDTLRADRLHLHGNERPISPAMDALAARGLAFERAYSSTAWTVPSTASLFTGMSPPEHGIGATDSYYLADSLVTVSEAFQLMGFTTGAFVCNPLISSGHNFTQGFEDFSTFNWPHAREIEDEFSEWLRAKAGERFFLYLHFIDPHYPYEPKSQAADGLVSEPPASYVERSLDKYLEEFYADPHADLAELRGIAAHQLDLYDAEVREVDAVIGRLIDLLDELGLTETTLVALTSDHGEEFLDHGWGGHHSQLFDSQTRVPLILAGAGVPRGVRPQAPVENRFLAPTLLRLAGLDPPANLRGPSLLDAEEPGGLASQPVFLTNSQSRWADLGERRVERLGPVNSVIHDGWRLVWSPARPGDGTAELLALYSTTDDPDCRTDLSAEHPERVQHLRSLIQTWLDDGVSRRPWIMPAAEATLEMLRDLGYIGDEDS